VPLFCLAFFLLLVIFFVFISFHFVSFVFVFFRFIFLFCFLCDLFITFWAFLLLFITYYQTAFAWGTWRLSPSSLFSLISPFPETAYTATYS
jgi:hypothetical protein